MKNSKYYYMLLSLLFAGIGVAKAQANDTAAAKTAIRQLVQRYEDAWNRHDAKGLADNYDSNATWVNWFGAYYIGKKDIEQHYAAVHNTYFKSSHYFTRKVEDIVFIKPDVAIAHVRTGLSGDTRFPGQTFEFRRTIVLTRHGALWLILAGQNAKLNEGVQ